MFSSILIIISLVLLAYLLGSIPSAVWIGKAFFGTDVREFGSKNAGATNTLRVLGRKAALPVFVIDALKGYLAVMLSWFSVLPPIELEAFSELFVNLRILLIVAVILGHIFPLFAGFRGGKGVATITGAMLAFAPVPMILSFIVFLALLFWKHYVSLGSITAGACFPIFMIISPWVSHVFRLNERLCINDVISPTMILFSLVVALALLFTHRKNIKRLLDGTESKTYIFTNQKK
ncbi:MAG: glycerol-3-phosphate 1-O-acyltransferase PlsY [Mucinivorans sp.]